MKNLKYIFLLLILPAMFFACEDEKTYDGPARVKFEKTANNITIPLNDTIDIVNVQLVSAPLKSATDVKVTVSGGTAERGKHFNVSLPEKLTIPAGENIVSFEIELYYSAFNFLEERTIEFTLEGSSDVTAIPVVDKYTLKAIPVATLTYSEVGVGSYQSIAFGGTYDVTFERCDQLPNIYIMMDFYTNPIEIIVDPANNIATIDPQDVGEDVFGAGSNSWIYCTAGTFYSGVITFGGGVWDNALFTNEGMGSGYRFVEEVITLPAGSW